MAAFFVYNTVGWNFTFTVCTVMTFSLLIFLLTATENLIFQKECKEKIISRG